MRNAIIASSALMAGRAVALGTAHVVNACNYEVHMSNTPASGGGFEAIDKVLSPGGSYSQEWTQLGNDMGWSIKLAKSASYQTDLMQYEYTYHNDGIIWYDLSEVDGNPWDGNWMITASGQQCNPKQQAYRYSTDDAYGMQSCPAESEITVTLCSGESQEDGDASSASEALSSKVAASTSSPAEEPQSTSWAQASTTTAPASSPSATDSSDNNNGGWGGHSWGMDDGVIRAAANTDAKASPSPTTLVTKKVSTADEGGYDVTVTDVQTVVQTAYVTAGADKAKRHEHHPRHPHQKREE